MFSNLTHIFFTLLACVQTNFEKLKLKMADFSPFLLTEIEKIFDFMIFFKIKCAWEVLPKFKKNCYICPCLQQSSGTLKCLTYGYFVCFIRPDEYLLHQWMSFCHALHMHLLQSSHKSCEVFVSIKFKIRYTYFTPTFPVIT